MTPNSSEAAELLRESLAYISDPKGREAVEWLINEIEWLGRGLDAYRAKRMADGGSVETPEGRTTQKRPWDAVKHYHAEIAVDEWEREQERRMTRLHDDEPRCANCRQLKSNHIAESLGFRCIAGRDSWFR